MHNRDQLENIRRKAPATRKPVQNTACEDLQAAISRIEELQAQLQPLKDAQKGIDVQLERNDTMCQELVAQVGKLHGKLMEYEDLIQNLLVRLAQKEFEERVLDVDRAGSTVAKSQCANCGGYSLEVKKRGGNNGGHDTGKDADNNEGIDEYDDMAEDMDDQDDDVDISTNNDHIPTNTSSRSQGLTPFIIENSTPLAQNYDPVERGVGCQEPVAMEVDEIMGSRNWAIDPFDPGGVHSGWQDRKSDSRSYPGDSQSKSMFDILLSKSVSDGQSWLKIHSGFQSQKQSSDNVSVVMSSPTTTPLQSPESPTNGIVEDLKTVNGPIGVLETRRNKRKEGIGLSREVSLLSRIPRIVKKEEVKIEVDMHQRQRCPPLPIVEAGPGLQSLSTVRQAPDAANLDKGKKKEKGETAVEMPPIPSSYSPPSHTAPILVVDDDPQCRRLLMLFFAYNKQEIDCAVCANSLGIPEIN